jgi:CRP-like cAMP-binding protein
MTERTVEISALKQTPFFAELPDGELQDIIDVGSASSFAAGVKIVEEGDRADGMYIVLSGEARVDVGGRFHILKTGDFFGEMALIAPSKRMATVKAESAVEVLAIPAEGFQAFLLEHPRVAVAMLKAIVLRLREVEQRIDAWMGT